MCIEMHVVPRGKKNRTNSYNGIYRGHLKERAVENRNRKWECRMKAWYEER